jgi:hypothetical protein
VTVAIAGGEFTPVPRSNRLAERLARCMGVSVITTILSVTIILVSTVALGLAARS